MILALMLAASINVFVAESPSYAKEMVPAARELMVRHPELHFTIRTTEQVNDMPAAELKQDLDEASVVVLGRIYGDVAVKIQDVFRTVNRPRVVFAAHSDFGVYELSRYGTDRPFNNVTHEQIDRISSGSLAAKDIPQLQRWGRSFDYLNAKGLENFQGLFLDLISNVDATYKPEPVRIPPAVFIYRDGVIYPDAQSFDSTIRRGRPTVAIIDHDSYYHSGDVEIDDRLAAVLDQAGINPVPIFAGWGAPTETAIREFVQSKRKDWDIRAIVSLQSFVLGGDQAREQVTSLFGELRLPIFRAMRMTKRSPDQWLLSSDGLPWASVYYQVAMPELQGMIEPIPVAAEVERTTDPVTGAAIASFVPIEERIQTHRPDHAMDSTSAETEFRETRCTDLLQPSAGQTEYRRGLSQRAGNHHRAFAISLGGCIQDRRNAPECRGVGRYPDETRNQRCKLCAGPDPIAGGAGREASAQGLPEVVQHTGSRRAR